MRYQVKVNDVNNFEIEVAKNGLRVNNEVITFDAVALTAAHSHILYQNKSYKVEIVAFYQEEKSVSIKVNGNIYRVEVADQYDLLLKKLGMDNLQTNKVQEIKAPMPGLVLNVLVEVGQEVNKGDNLLVLEAMKMENILKSTTAGTIKEIKVIKGNKVEKNQVLLQFS
jgi:biotin carboxyl carrier protein